MTLKDNAKRVLEVLKRGTYNIAGKDVSIREVQWKAEHQSRLYTPEELEEFRIRSEGKPCSVVVEDGTTQQVARELSRDGSVALLNFASGRNPGGGFLNGAKAQEEDLCRCSGLYPTLLRHPAYYEANRSQNSMLYTDYAIFSPDVPFFRLRGTGDFLEEPFECGVITAPAPNSGPHLDRGGNESDLETCFARRWLNVLAIARDQGVTNVLLGAWGCGAFRGDPEMSARTARQAIEVIGPAFEKIVFAIPNTGKRSKANYEMFRQTLR